MEYKNLTKQELLDEISKLKKQAKSTNHNDTNCYPDLFNIYEKPIVVYDINESGQIGKYFYPNKKAIQALGYSSKDSKKLTLKNIIPDSYRNKIISIHKRLLKNKEISFSSFVVCKNKQLKPVDISLHLFRKNNQYLVSFLFDDLFQKNQTEFRRYEKTNQLLLKLFLKASELNNQELYDYILDVAVDLTNSEIGFFHRVSPDQKKIILSAWNKKALKNCKALYNTHYPIKQAGNWVDSIHYGRPVIYNNFEFSPNQKGLPQGHVPIKRFMSVPVVEQGKVKFIFGVGNKPEDYNEQDIFQVKLITSELTKILSKHRASQKLKENEEKFRNIFNNSILGFYRTTPGGRIIMANTTLAKMLGYSSISEFKKITLKNNHFDKDSPRSKFIDLINREGKIINLESVWIKKDGSKVHVSESAKAVYNSSGEIKYYEGNVIDITQHRKTQDALYASEKLYKSLFEAANDSIFLMKDDEFIECNQKTCVIFECSKQEILNTKPYMFSPLKQPDGRSSKEKAIEKITKALSGKPQFFEWVHKKFNGKKFNAEVSLNKVILNNEPYLQAIVRDITDRKQAEQELKNYKDKLEEAQKIARIGHWDLNLINNKLDWSDEVYKIFGISQDKTKHNYDYFLNTIHPDDRKYVDKAYENSLKSKTRYDVVHRIILPNKEIKYIHNQCKTSYSKSGKPIQSLGTVQDITDLKIAEKKLKQYQNHLEELVEKRTIEVTRLSQAVEQSPASVVITNIKGDIIYINKTFVENTGYTEEEALGQNPRILKAKHFPRVYYENLWKTILSGKIWKGELKNKRKDGTIFWESASISPIIDKNGNTTSFVAVKEDVTERKKLEKALIIAKEAAELATNAKSEFLANMSHEIRTPMNAILGFAELLQTLIEDKQQKNYLDALYSSGKNLLTIINDILDFSKVEAGKLELSIEQVNIRNFFSEIKHLFMLKSQAKGLDFSVDICENLPQSFFIDDLRLRQVLINLVNNAIKFTEKGKIKLKVTTLKSQKSQKSNLHDLIIEVEDTGIGITEKYKKYIFDSFSQESTNTTRKYGGSGLGLAISLKIIKLMDGDIFVQSKINKGSKFTIHIPNLKTTQKDTLIQKNNLKDINNIKFDPSTIIIVDDIENNRKYLTAALNKLGFKVYSCENGEIAFGLIQQIKPDLIISDIRMPVMDGFELLKQVRKFKKYDSIPIIAISASVTSNKRVKIKMSGFDGFLSKPILLMELVKLLTQFLPFTKKQTKEQKCFDELNLSEKAQELLPITISQLDNDYRNQWDNFRVRQPIEHVQLFGENLLKLAQETENEILSEYANTIINSINNFDVDTMLKTLEKYEDLIYTLKSFT
ncbi:MAG: PAS domain S-box protein [Bacteroidales bacterium]|nr:PAS domain S-box protein [Bacteroidales bacterium]